MCCAAGLRGGITRRLLPKDFSPKDFPLKDFPPSQTVYRWFARFRDQCVFEQMNHALVDTDGRPLLIEPHTADVQDRDGGGALLQVSRGLFPFTEKVWADGGYSHHRVTQATSITVEIVSKIAGQSGFVVLPRRWVVERFFAWVNRNRRLAKDLEATLKSAAAFLYAAAAMLMPRRLAKSN
jgi:transposase